MRVAIIGAGPSGLVTLKYLLQAHEYFSVSPIEARIFEAESGIGGTYRYRAYPEAEMVSSKFLTTFSDFRVPRERTDCGDFLTLAQYLQYLEDYCDHFNLRPHISLDSRVKNIRRRQGGGHIVTYGSDEQFNEWECDAVAVCAGLHVNPAMPKIPGIEKVPLVLHSSQYKSRDQFGVNKNVVLLGAGETAMDLGYFAITSPTKSVTICHRDGFVLVPKAVPNFMVMGTPETAANGVAPIDCNWNSLFDTAYVHDKLKTAPWLWEFYDKWNKFTWLLTNGTTSGFGQHVGGIKDLHLSKVIFVKSVKSLPYFNKRYIRDNFFQRIRRRIIDIVPADTHGRQIDIATWPTYVDEHGVMHFELREDRLESVYMENMKLKPDIVIYATGYQHHGFPFLSSGYPDTKDADVRSIWRTGDETVGFIGFVRPLIGAIPPLTEFQAQLWVMKILGQVPDDLQRTNWYKLFPDPEARLQHGVDHETYAYQLALDMGSAPSVTQILPMGFKTFLVWALGANFNTKFRLVGPWKWSGAEEVMRTEFWDLICRRQFFWGHFMLNALPIMIFGPLSLCYFIFYSILDLWMVLLEVFQTAPGHKSDAHEMLLNGRS